MLRCTKAWLNDIYATWKDYGIAWLIHGSSSWLQCEVAKYSYTFGDPKYRSAPVIVPPMGEGLGVFETIRSLCLLFELCAMTLQNWHVSIAVDKSEQTQRCSTLHSQHFSTQFTSPSKYHPGSWVGKLRTNVWKNYDIICFWKWLVLRISVIQTRLSPILLVVSGSPSGFSYY